MLFRDLTKRGKFTATCIGKEHINMTSLLLDERIEAVEIIQLRETIPLILSLPGCDRFEYAFMDPMREPPRRDWLILRQTRRSQKESLISQNGCCDINQRQEISCT